MSKLKPKRQDNDEEKYSSFDLSLIKRSVHTTVTGFTEVLRAYYNGSKELKKLLTDECDLLYECKVCRNIFRSLTNFIAHKRVYCSKSFDPTKHYHFRNEGFMDDDFSVITQEEEKRSDNMNMASKSPESLDVAEQIFKKRNNSVHTPNQVDSRQQFKNNCDDDQENQKAMTYKNILISSVQNKSDKTLVDEEISKSKNSSSSEETKDHYNKEAHLYSEELDNNYKCKICNLQSETKTSLKLHLEMAHYNSSIFVYQCPSCIQSFPSSAAVVAHLSDDHKKSNRRIRLMRDHIIKKRVYVDQMDQQGIEAFQNIPPQNSKTSEILNKPKQKIEESKLENSVDEELYECPSCLKKIDRKVVYTSHVQICSDIKDREQEKLKKRKAKNGIKKCLHGRSSVETEVNINNIAEYNDGYENNKINKLINSKIVQEIDRNEENSELIVDWNLDDEEEEKKLENIKKEIIEHDCKQKSENIEHEIITKVDDECQLKIDINVSLKKGEHKCSTCNKVFKTAEKLKYHMTFYHSRQKRFKCKMCEYQGYRKKDTMNHINFAHNANVTFETLSHHIETVSKAINVEDVKIQNELKKKHLKIKRKMARENQRKNVEQARLKAMISDNEKNNTGSSDLSNTDKCNDTNLICENDNKTSQIFCSGGTTDQEKNEIPKYLTSLMKQSFETTNNSDISQYEKTMKHIDPIDLKDSSQNSRPIRNRIKPVRKDFLYDLSDLLKKEADAHREQATQSSNITVKKELRKRAMSTNACEIHTDSFPQICPNKPITDSFAQPVSSTTNDKYNDQKHRRMSVFIPQKRSMFPPQPRSPPYRPPATHKNAGSAYLMASKEFDKNKASVYEPKFLWTICFMEENEKNYNIPTKFSNTSAASNILQKLSGISSETTMLAISEPPVSLTADQLCRKFESINMTSMKEIDGLPSNAINLNLGMAENSLVEAIGSSSIIKYDNDDESYLAKRREHKNFSTKKTRRRSNRNDDKLTQITNLKNSQKRLTVMQRLQENKIRKSKEQIFQRLMHQADDNEDSLDAD